MQIIYSGIKHLSEALKDSKKVLLVCDSSFPFLNIKEDIQLQRDHEVSHIVMLSYN